MPNPSHRRIKGTHGGHNSPLYQILRKEMVDLGAKFEHFFFQMFAVCIFELSFALPRLVLLPLCLILHRSPITLDVKKVLVQINPDGDS